MFNDFDILPGGKARRKCNLTLTASLSKSVTEVRSTPSRGPTFTRIFRWQPPDLHLSPPDAVQVAGSFTGWRPIALKRDAITKTWQLTLHDIPGNRTHRYMLLVNDEPALDKHADGLAMPESPDEQRFQLLTARGPRVFLLFAQTK